MSEQDDESLIGYDPLAWLQQPENQADTEAPAMIQAIAIEPDQEEAIVPPAETESVAVSQDWVGEEEVSSEAPDTDVQIEYDEQIVLESVQNIQNVAQLYDRLLGALDKANNIDIDASAIGTIDTATLQLLLVLKQTAAKMQKQVNIDFPSEKFIEAADLLGLTEMLDVDHAAAGFF